MPDPAPTADPDRPTELAGRGIRIASWAGTAVFTVTAVAAAIDPHILAVLAAAVSVAGIMFFAGIAIFFWAYAVAVNRSRTDLIGMGGLFFLAGSAPRPIQRSLLGSLGVQVAVGLGTALAHPFTPLAFGVLAWMYGLALCGLWAARYGTFAPRPPAPERRKGRAQAKAKAAQAGSASKPNPKAKAGGSARTGKRGGGRTTPKSDATSGSSGASAKRSKAGKPKSRSSYL